MKKIFTLLVLMLAVVGAKAADVVLFNADFSQLPWAGHTFVKGETFNGIYATTSKTGADPGSINSNGVLTFQPNNMNSSNFFAIKVSGVNGKINVTFKTQNATGKENMRFLYSVTEENGVTAPSGSTDTKAYTGNEFTFTYTMTGEGQDAVLYFGRQGSGYTDGILGVTITTPDASTVITYEITNVTLNGTDISATQLSTLTSSKALTVTDAFDGLPTVKYTVKTTTTTSEGSKDESEELTAVVEEDGENYSATLNAGTKEFVITFTNVTYNTTLTVTEETTVLLTKDNITSKGYLSVTTDNWTTESKTYGGISGYFYNMSDTERKININVTGAKYMEAFVQNTNANRNYSLNGTTITHGGSGVESSGLIAISNGTVILAGGGSSVYPVYVKFYTEQPPVSVTIPAFGYATLCSSNDVVSNGECYKATKLVNGVVTIVPVQGVIPAGTGIIVKGTAGTVTLPIATEGTTEADLLDNKMVGVLTDTDMTGKSCYILSDGAFWPCSGGTLAAGKAYLDIAPTSGAKAIEIDVDGQETAISTVNAEQQNGNIYTINGVQVKNAQQKGIYIINGKKVVK